jgi:hypothetical protein
MKKILMAVLMALCLVSVPAMADVSSNYEVDNIYFNGFNVNDGTLYVERGDSVAMTVYMTGLGETTDVNIQVWIGGYEYDDVYTTSAMFDVEDGVSYRKDISLQLPDDMIAEQEYSVYVEIYDGVDYVREEATIMVSKERHDVRIQDVVVENSVDAGDYTTVTVRLENMGDTKEEDIKVTLYNEELNIESSVYMDELTNYEIDNEDEEETGEVSLVFPVSGDADGAYTLDVTVTYNNGYSETVGEAILNIEGEAAAEGSVVVVEDNTVDNDTSFVTALKLGFGILAVLIVILALILIVRK